MVKHESFIFICGIVSLGDIDFQLSFLPVSKLFVNTEELQEQIWTRLVVSTRILDVGLSWQLRYCSIKQHFPCEPIMWDALARRPWNEVETSLLSGNHSNNYVIML